MLSGDIDKLNKQAVRKSIEVVENRKATNIMGERYLSPNWMPTLPIVTHITFWLQKLNQIGRVI